MVIIVLNHADSIRLREFDVVSLQAIMAKQFVAPIMNLLEMINDFAMERRAIIAGLTPVGNLRLNVVMFHVMNQRGFAG